MAFSEETFESMVKALALPPDLYHIVFVTGLGTKANVLVKIIKHRVHREEFQQSGNALPLFSNEY